MTAPPLPVIDGPDQPFWQGLRQREIRVQGCAACGRVRFPAARYCPHCHSDETEWRRVEPKGEVESWCVFHQQYFAGLDVPYTVIQVRLDCGIRLFSNPVGVAADKLILNMPVEAVFEDVTPQVTLLKFRPAGGKA
jgi:uncharacterized OB-fold protein